MVRKLRSRATAWSLRAYFVLLFALLVAGSIAGALYVDREASRDARTNARQDALFSARTAATQLESHVALLKATAAGLAANPQIAKVFDNPKGCTLAFQGFGGADKGHLDIIRANGSVACSSRPLSDAGYAASTWLPEALERAMFLAPVRDDVVGGPMAIASSPVPGGKGAVVAFADLAALGPSLASLYGGGRPNVFTVTTADNRTVVARSTRPAKWIGTKLTAADGDLAPGAERTDLEGVTRLYAHATVQKAGWNVYVGEDRSAVLASVTSLRNRQLALITMGLLVFLLAAALIYRQVASPIRRLSEAVRTTRDDDGAGAVPVSGPVEVRALGEDLNALTAAVQRELQERRRAEESYRHLFESNPRPMWLFDYETHRFLAVNDAALASYGYTRDEFLAMVIEDIRPPSEVDRLHSLLASRDLETGLRTVGIWRHKRKDGSEFDAEISSHDHLFEGRNARVVMSLDVSERVQAEEALRRSEARYRDLFENASDLITSTDLDGRLTAVNEAFVRSTGYSREELVGTPLAELVPAERRAGLRSARDLEQHGADATVYDSELQARDGHRIQIEVASRLIFEHGQPVGTEAICRDITERLELEEQLRQAQRLEAIGRLAGGVAHDFNNLLTVISGYTESLLEGRDRSEEFELGQIAAAADRAAILTRQLLAFSRRQVLQPRVILLNEVVEGITPMISRLIGEDLELVASLDPDLNRVLADPNQVEQVLLNLAVNARDAMPNGGRLTIQTANVELDEEYVAHHGESTAGPHVMLSVTDTGTGMEPDTLAHMFEPFFSTKPVGSGTGLGLATVYGIVKQSEGSIWVYSEPGKGTTFKIYLPATEAAAALEAPRATRPLAAVGLETILLAEDEEPLRTLTAKLLERHGYVVITATSADEALRIAAENSRRIDLLLTDLIMPGLSGSTVAERVSELVPGVKVLFMSGYSDDIVVRNGILAPGAAFLEKPFSSTDLAAKVRATLDTAA